MKLFIDCDGNICDIVPTSEVDEFDVKHGCVVPIQEEHITHMTEF